MACPLALTARCAAWQHSINNHNGILAQLHSCLEMLSHESLLLLLMDAGRSW